MADTNIAVAQAALDKALVAFKRNPGKAEQAELVRAQGEYRLAFMRAGVFIA